MNSLVQIAEDNSQTETFSCDVKEAFKQFDDEQLENLYKIISEETDLNKAKMQCRLLYNSYFDNILSIIKNSSNDFKEKTLKYYAWHFLQLMSCHPPAKKQLENDEYLISRLVEFNKVSQESHGKQKSLKTVSLNLIVYLLGGATDRYFDLIASSNAIHFIYELLDESSMNAEDEMFETILLAINFLLEGTSKCKQILREMSFDNLISKKIKDRSNCHSELLKITNLTYQKLLLLGSDDKRFYGEFRKNFQKEAEKQIIYQSVVCSYENCVLKDNGTNEMKRCSRCKVTNYCSKDCQRAHWKSSHSKQCIPKS